MDTEGWRLFLQLVQQTDNQPSLDELFQFLLTHEEREHMAKRIVLVRELMRGEKTQREIAKELNISIAKITRGSNNLKQIDDRLKQQLQLCLL